MKVVQINSIYGKDSTGENCRDIVEFLWKYGHQGYCIAPEGEESRYFYKLGYKRERKLHALLARIVGLQGYFSWLSTWKMIHVLNQIEPDIVHLNNVHANYVHLLWLMRFLNKKKIHVFMTLHDAYFYTGKCNHYTQRGCYKWMEGCCKCGHLKEDIPSLFFDFTNKMWSDKKKMYARLEKLNVIGVSDWICAEAKKSILSSAKRITRIYNWVDLEVFVPLDNRTCRNHYQIPMNAKVVISVASYWTKAKGIEELIRISEILPDGYIVLVVGKYYGKKSKKIRWMDSIQDKTALAGLYSLSNVYLNLSLEESFGKVSAEAMACGTPVVCIDSTANKEVVGTGCGVVLDTRSIEEIYDAIIDVCNSPKSFYKTACRDYAELNFSKTENLSQYMRLYENAIVS